MTQLVLLRHGESTSNRDGHFTGWNDVELSPKGELEAERRGPLAQGEQDSSSTCALLRNSSGLPIHYASYCRQWSSMRLTVRRSWRLNERHYGALEGIGPLSAIRKVRRSRYP